MLEIVKVFQTNIHTNIHTNNLIDNNHYHSRVIRLSGIKYNIVLFKPKKKDNKYIIYPVLNMNIDKDINFSVGEIYLSKIYRIILIKRLNSLFEKYQGVPSVIYDIILSYTNLGNVHVFQEIYKTLINMTIFKNKTL